MPGLFSSATLEQIRAASDIVDVIGSYVPLKRAGANFTALCPFHKEKSPSFNVNPHRQIFHCFGCHKGGDHFYDRFRGRLMFPICDEQGRVIGFSGRVLSGDEKTAKYVNSPETPIFTKSKVFFGLDKSKRAVLDAGYAIICEGQLDLIACFMAGVQNIVAPQGTAFTADHARIIKRYVDEVVLCFDSDEAGQNAAVRSLDHLLESGLAVRVAVVPAPHDPDSFIKASGGEAFRQLVENAEGFFDYYLNRLCKLNDANSDKGRNAILRGMAEAVHKTGNLVLIDT